MWLSTPEKVLLKQHARQSKYNLYIVEETELVEVNFRSGRIRLQNSSETTVYLCSAYVQKYFTEIQDSDFPPQNSETLLEDPYQNTTSNKTESNTIITISET